MLRARVTSVIDLLLRRAGGPRGAGFSRARESGQTPLACPGAAAFAAVLACLITSTSLGAAVEGEVVRYEVDFGRPMSDWFLFDLDDDGRRDAFALFDEGGGRTSWALALQTSPRDFEKVLRGSFEGVVALALGDFGAGSGQQMALLYPDRVQLLAITEGGLEAAGAPLPYRGFARAGLADVPGFWHWAEDLDGDELDDLYLPGEDGIVVYFGRGGGEFEDRLELAVPTERRAEIGAEGVLDIVSFRPHPLFRDVDGDGRADLCWFDHRGLWYRCQKAERSFAEARCFELNWLSSDTPGLLDRTDVDLEDLDDDGLADLVMSRMQSQEGSLTKIETTLVVLRNRGGDEPFVRKPDTALVLEGIVGSGPHFVDADGDGYVDLVFSTFGSGLSGVLNQFLGKVKVQLFQHLGTGNDETPFSTTPSYQTKVSLDSADFERWKARNSAFLHEDLDGDGIAELYVLEKTRTGHRFVIRKGRRDVDGYAASEDPHWVGEVDGVESVTVRTLRDGEPQVLVFVREAGFAFVDFR